MIRIPFWYTLPILVCLGCGQGFRSVQKNSASLSLGSTAEVTPANTSQPLSTPSTTPPPTNISTQPGTAPACTADVATKSAIQNSLAFFRVAVQNPWAQGIASGCLNAIQTKINFMNQWGWSCDVAAQLQSYIGGCNVQVQNLLSMFNTIDCPASNGHGIARWTELGWGSCQATSCNSGFNLQAGMCIANICAPSSQQSCPIANGIGVKSCNTSGTGWGECGNATACDPGYVASNGACHINQQQCSLANGSGVQNWVNGAWGECLATSCATGFVPYGASCAPWLKPGLEGKFLVGYQGWFSAKGDNNPYTTPTDSWSHWANWGSGAPTFTNVSVEMWPDMSEYTQTYPTKFTYQDGSNARVFSSYDYSTVQTHFSWMQQYGIDGAVLQRFVVSHNFGPDYMSFTNQVAINVVNAAQATGRVFCLLIDTAGTSPDTFVTDVINEWQFDVNTLGLLRSPNYLRDNGKPVVFLAAFGETSRPVPNPTQAAQIIQYFKDQGVTVVGMAPTNWRTQGSGTQKDPAWLGVFHSYDVINPWTVGAFSNLHDADQYVSKVMVEDIKDAKNHGQRFMPVIYPGFSVSNLCAVIGTCQQGIQFNVIPRLGGQFWWKQAYRYMQAGANMMYGAMFDEIDEGTAIFKIAPTQAQTPAQAPFISLDADGYALPSDWYLQLAQKTADMLHGTRPVNSDFPLPMPTHVPAPTNPNAQMLFWRGSINLRENQSITRDGFILYMQDDGNLVLKHPSGYDLWNSGTPGLCMDGSTYQSCLATYQGSDGNFVIYNLVTGASVSLGGLGSQALIFNRESSDPLLFEY